MRWLPFDSISIATILILPLTTPGAAPAADDAPVAYRGARIYTAAGAPLDKGC